MSNYYDLVPNGTSSGNMLTSAKQLECGFNLSCSLDTEPAVTTTVRNSPDQSSLWPRQRSDGSSYIRMERVTDVRRKRLLQLINTATLAGKSAAPGNPNRSASGRKDHKQERGWREPAGGKAVTAVVEWRKPRQCFLSASATACSTFTVSDRQRSSPNI